MYTKIQKVWHRFVSLEGNSENYDGCYTEGVNKIDVPLYTHPIISSSSIPVNSLSVSFQDETTRLFSPSAPSTAIGLAIDIDDKILSVLLGRLGLLFLVREEVFRLLAISFESSLGLAECKSETVSTGSSIGDIFCILESISFSYVRCCEV